MPNGKHKKGVEKTTKKNTNENENCGRLIFSPEKKRQPKKDALRSKARLSVSAEKLSTVLAKRLARREYLREQLANKNRGSRLAWRSPANLLRRCAENSEAYKSADEIRRELDNLRQNKVEKMRQELYSLDEKDKKGHFSENERLSAEVFMVVRSVGECVEVVNSASIPTNAERYLIPSKLWEVLSSKKRRGINDLRSALRVIAEEKRNTHEYPSVAFLNFWGFSDEVMNRAVNLGYCGKYRYIFRHRLAEKIKRSAFYGLKIGGGCRVDMRTTGVLSEFIWKIRHDITEVKRISGDDEYGDKGDFELGTVGF